MNVTRAAGVSGRAQLVGTGLIGGSIGAALRRLGWHVTGHDASDDAAQRAKDLGAIDDIGFDETADVCFVAIPVGRVADAVRDALERSSAVVTDVGSVKASLTEEIQSERFVGGHPMAGSEQEGVDGSDPNMFSGAVWVLTPTEFTDPGAYGVISTLVTQLGADVVTLDPQTHDRVVAVVSHVPHLTAATLMGLASAHGTEHAALLRLAAGGFRDMTRIAAGHPGIWPDICAANSTAIVDVLDDLIASLSELRTAVADNDRETVMSVLSEARAARLNLAPSATRPDQLVEMRIRISDEPGQIAAITAEATQLGVNIYDLEIAHSGEGVGGVLIMLADREQSGPFGERLNALSFAVSTRELS